MGKYAQIGFTETTFSSSTYNFNVYLKECGGAIWLYYNTINYDNFPIYVDIEAFLGEVNCYSYRIIEETTYKECYGDINIPSPTPTPSITPSVTPTNTTTPTNTPTNTQTPTSTVTPTNTPTSTNTQTPTGTVTPTNTPTLSVTPSITPTISITPSVTPTIYMNPTPPQGDNTIYVYYPNL